MPLVIWLVSLSVIFIGGSIVFVLSHRYKLLPTFDRVTPSWYVGAILASLFYFVPSRAEYLSQVEADDVGRAA